MPINPDEIQWDDSQPAAESDVPSAPIKADEIQWDDAAPVQTPEKPRPRGIENVLQSAVDIVAPTIKGAVAGAVGKGAAVGKTLLDRATALLTGADYDPEAGAQAAREIEQDVGRRLGVDQKTGSTLEPVGEKIAQVLSIPAELGGKAAGYAGEKLGLDPTSQYLLESAGQIGGGLAVGEGFRMAGEASRARHMQASAEAAGHKDVNSWRDSVAKDAMDSGAIIPPHLLGENKFTAALAGAADVNKEASAKNALVWHNRIAEEIGLPQNRPISPETLNQVRNDIFEETYRPILNRQAIKVDDQYIKDLDAIKGRATTSKAPPSDVASVIEDMRPDQPGGTFSADAVLNDIATHRALRSDIMSGKYAPGKTGSKGLADAHAAVAEALENLIERNLSKEDLAIYRHGRQQLAKTYTVEDAINPGNQIIDLRKIGRMVASEPRKFSGEIRKAGDFANAFPDAAIPLTKAVGFGTGGLKAQFPVVAATAEALSSADRGPAEMMAEGGRGAIMGLIPRYVSSRAREYLMTKAAQNRALPDYAPPPPPLLSRIPESAGEASIPFLTGLQYDEGK